MDSAILMVLEANFPKFGGAERQLETLANALQQQGHRVRVVLPRLLPEYPAGADRHNGLDLWRIDYPRLRLLGTLVLLLKLSWWLWRERKHYDAIHVHIAHHMGAVAALVGRLLGKPVVLKFSGWWELERGCLRPDGGIGAALSRWMLRRASGVQAISTRFIEDLKRYGFRPERLHWIPNAVDTTRFEKIVHPSEGHTPSTVVFVGRLVAEKGLDNLLRAWAMAAEARHGWRLLLVGDGPLRDSLLALAEALGVADSVVFHGASTHVEQQLAEADIGVLASRFEGLSNTLLECMAAGLPMIATRISGSEDFVETGRNGWLCAADSVEALSEALRTALNMAPAMRRQLGDQARADVVARASIAAVTSQLVRLYRTPAGAH
ncbi:MAG TPA: glycosyltransferase family 4 protein [Aquimonas sp.]|nr:glycosyltransferase family 4 protein [Aquimonas sp.]HRF53736.1 glycosyltransferase family 4 protein [Aquimonas sp.]